MSAYWKGVFARAWRETAAEARLDTHVRRWLVVGTPLIILAVGWLVSRTILVAAAITLGFLALVVLVTLGWKFLRTPPRLADETAETIRAQENQIRALSLTRADERVERARELYFDRQTHRFIGFAPTIIRQPQFALIVVPLSAADGGRVQSERLQSVTPHFTPPGFSDAEEGNDENEWWTYDPKVLPEPLKNGVSRWCTRLFNNGVFEHVQMLSETSAGVVDGRALERAIVAMADHLSTACGTLGFGSEAIIGVTLHGVTDITLSDGRHGPRPFQKPLVPLDVVVSRRLGENVGDDLRPLFDTLWRAAGWRTGAPSFADGKWQGYVDAARVS
jgi:hypothetical protein